MYLFKGIFIFLALALAAGKLEAASGDYSPAVPVETHEALYPFASTAMGIVSLVAGVDQDGHVSEVTVVNSIPSLDEPSVAAAKKWKFEPARKAGKPIPSKASISFIYDRVFGYPSFSPIKITEAGVSADYTPPIPVVGRRGKYPFNSIARGTVVVVADVEEDGRASRVRVIKSVLSLDNPSARAAKEWVFEPAKYKGKPIRSKASIGFVYEPRLSSLIFFSCRSRP